MEKLPLAQHIERAAATPEHDAVVLDYEARFLRRKRLTSAAGVVFVVDLEQTTNRDNAAS